MTHPSEVRSPTRTNLSKSGVLALLLLVCMVPLLASCGLHSGANVIAFLRDGALWTIQSDGSSPMLVVPSGVDGFAWSPDHHQLVFRFGSHAFPRPPQSALGAPDAPSDLAIVSVNGGTSLQITPQTSGALRSDAWWNPGGTRLVYRERLNASNAPPTYVVSQADQPVGIARKPVYGAAIPVLSPDGKQVATVDGAGDVRLGMPGALGTVLASGALLTLPDTTRPARLLWQPNHNALLYATGAPAGVSLVLRDLQGGSSARTLLTLPALLDVAFSPDGAWLLIHTPADFQLYTVATPTTPVFRWPEMDPLALPWWAPDSRAILVQNVAGWQQVDIPTRAIHPLLTYSQPGVTANLAATTDWHPAASSPFSPDGTQIVFVAPAGSTWLGSQLPRPTSDRTGLYVASFQHDSPGQLVLIDSGTDYAPSWGYPDPSTTFLVAS